MRIPFPWHRFSSKERLFADDEALSEIMATAVPSKVKALGRAVNNLDDDVWKADSRQLVTEGNMAKFNQHEDLRAFLLSSGDQVLAEASPYDRIWGIGLKATREKTPEPILRRFAVFSEQRPVIEAGFTKLLH